jgi:hypothetical protein
MDIQRIATSAAAGLASTVMMSAWMLAGQRVTSHGEQPPKRIVRGVGERAGVTSQRRGAGTLFATAVAHAGFGAGCGALYGMVIRRSNVLRGAVFGLGIWAISYAGWVPALELLPPPHTDTPGRAWTILTAHGIYGGFLGALVAGYDREQPQRP